MSSGITETIDLTKAFSSTDLIIPGFVEGSRRSRKKTVFFKIAVIVDVDGSKEYFGLTCRFPRDRRLSVTCNCNVHFAKIKDFVNS